MKAVEKLNSHPSESCRVKFSIRERSSLMRYDVKVAAKPVGSKNNFEAGP